jgi:hypothetical protein
MCKLSVIWVVCLVHFVVLGMSSLYAKQTEANIKTYIESVQSH